MAYVRISLMKPQPGREKDARKLNDDLLASFKAQKGFLTGYGLSPTDGSGEVGRLTLWENAEAADHAASQQRVMALRSQLHIAAQPGHSERSFTTD